MLDNPTQTLDSWLAALPDETHGIFVSDLHGFSPRSTSQYVLSELSSPPNYDLIVLGGDIFDFRWSAYSSVAESIDQAEAWIEQLLGLCSTSQILFLPGNHDCLAEFLERLDQLASRNPLFAWMPHHAQIGDTLFLHGDILDAGKNLGDLATYRAKFQHEKTMPQHLHWGYDMIVGMRVHKMVPRVRHQPSKTCSRLLRLMDELSLPDRASVKRVFFGHTHVPIIGQEIQGTTFYNPGACLRHMNYRPQEFLLTK